MSKIGIFGHFRPGLARQGPHLTSDVQQQMGWGTRLGLAGSFGALLVGGCGAWAVSRKTPIYFIFSVLKVNIHADDNHNRALDDDHRNHYNC